MWIVKSCHVGKDGTYSKEEETATDEEWARKKYRRKLRRWVEILKCKNVVLCDADEDEEFELDFKDQTKDIQDSINECQLYILNKQIGEGSSFSLVMFEEQ